MYIRVFVVSVAGAVPVTAVLRPFVPTVNNLITAELKAF
jgi:hypothetical protein